MTPVFADTSFYVALVSPTDQAHGKAIAIADHSDAPILTTEFIIVELGNFLRRRRQRSLFLELERDIRLDDQCIVIPASQAILEKNIELFRERPDKECSLTDCISFVVMQDHSVSEALTADQHFEQAGFTPLLAD